MQNTIRMLVDLKKETYRFDQVQQGDDVILDITLLENGVAKDITGETVELIYINANNTVASVTGDKVVVTGNNIKITCPRDCTRSYGIAKFQLKIIGTYQVSTFPIALTIVPGVNQGQPVSQNISTILEDLTAKNIECKETLESLNAWVAAHGDITALDARVESLASQLEEIPNQTYIIDKATKLEVDVERKRIDSFTKLSEGSTTGDAELIDGRVGEDGVTYDNIGNAIRTQIKNINENIGDKPKVEIKNEKPSAIYNTLSTNTVPLFENGKKYEIEVTLLSNVTSAYIQLSKSQSSGDIFINFAKNISLNSGKYTYSFIYDSSMGNDIFLRLYLDNDYIKCNNYRVNKYSDSNLWNEVKNNMTSIESANNKINEIYPYSLREIGSILEIVKNQGKFVNANTNKLTALESYFYSDFIIINKNQTISVTSKDPSGSSVGRISRYKNINDEIAEKIIALGTTEESTVKYTAQKDGEIIRFSGFIENPFKVSLSYLEIPDGFENAINSLIKSFISKYTSISMFEKVGVCGDSYTIGSIYNENGYVKDCPNLSWGKIMGRLNGINVSIFARRGSDTENYQTREDCLPLLLSSEPMNAYILCLGINDKASVTLGSINDIHDDYTTNPNTYYGNYGKIIAQIKNHAPNSVLFISQLFTVGIPNSSYYWAKNAITEIANKFNMIVIDTAKSDFINSEWFINHMLGSHPTVPLHSGMGREMTRLIDNSIQDNIDLLQNYIG